MAVFRIVPENSKSREKTGLNSTNIYLNRSHSIHVLNTFKHVLGRS